jgi:hypothetical protein
MTEYSLAELRRELKNLVSVLREAMAEDTLHGERMRKDVLLSLTESANLAADLERACSQRANELKPGFDKNWLKEMAGS